MQNQQEIANIFEAIDQIGAFNDYNIYQNVAESRSHEDLDEETKTMQNRQRCYTI